MHIKRRICPCYNKDFDFFFNDVTNSYLDRFGRWDQPLPNRVGNFGDVTKRKKLRYAFLPFCMKMKNDFFSFKFSRYHDIRKVNIVRMIFYYFTINRYYWPIYYPFYPPSPLFQSSVKRNV